MRVPSSHRMLRFNGFEREAGTRPERCQSRVYARTSRTQLGSPISHTTHLDGSSTKTYEFHTGNEPNLWSATGHGVMDFMTFGLWEIFGTPCELALGSENTHQLLIVYGPDDSVLSINRIPLSKKEQNQTSPEKSNWSTLPDYPFFKEYSRVTALVILTGHSPQASIDRKPHPLQN